MFIKHKQLFLIIDGNAYVYRAYYALKYFPKNNNKSLNAVYGFIQFLFKIKKIFQPDYILVCFDYPARYFRHEIFLDYKQNRKPLEIDIIEQMTIIREECLNALNIQYLEIKGYEADDLIATIVTKNSLFNNLDSIIVSGDKDVLQLIDQKIRVWDDSKKIMYSNKEVQLKYGVSPTQLIDVFALTGDIVDNIPGIKGIGLKTAVKLVNTFGTIETIFRNMSTIKGNLNKLLHLGKREAKLSKSLIKLYTAVPLNFKLNDYKTHDLNVNKAYTFFQKYKFNSFIQKYCN
ncbi:MAG: hypothetical protein LBM05_00740 [Endomicrobium sp.]|jgi:DNA polymerase-1|nr:hypothetical protein [Endomicrobium sp.]